MTYTDSADCDSGSNQCDFYFKPIQFLDKSGKILSETVQTDDTGGSNTVRFSNVETLKYPINITFPNNSDVKFSITIYDEDPGTDDFVRSMENLVVPFTNTAVADGWEEKDYVRDTSEGKATLTIKYKVKRCSSHYTGLGCNSCEDNFYGTECSNYCEPNPGYYNCDSCVTRESCQTCADNYYPEGTCDAHCLPDPEKYFCSDQGEKECRGNRTGSSCEQCVANHFGEDCTKFCKKTTSYNCDESGEKDCKEHLYPPQKCDTHCEPVVGNYTCNQMTGERICVEGKGGEECDECLNSNNLEGSNCDRCIEQHYGEDCTVYCKPDIEHYNCSDNGIKLCVDNTTLPEHNCRRPNQNLNIPLIGAAGGGIGLFLILLFTCIILKVRKDRNKNVAEEILIGGETDNTQRNQYQEATSPTVNNQAAHSSEETGGVYSRINRQEQGNRKQHTQIGPDQNQDALYSTIQSQPVYATVDKGDKYAPIDRHEGTSNGTYGPETERTNIR